MDIADSVLDLIGRTPMVRLTRVTEGIACPVVAKVETTNPGGSVKDRRSDSNEEPAGDDDPVGLHRDVE